MSVLYKVEGAGNDFLLGIGDWSDRLAEEPDLVRRLCHRRLGIGADGVVALEPEGRESVRIVYRNADGGVGAFCANATRCAARVAVEILGGASRLTVVTGWAEIAAEVNGSEVALELPEPGSLPIQPAIAPVPGIGSPSLLRLGVPHLVAPVTGLDDLDIRTIGPHWRFHESLGPDGANVNFYEAEDDGAIALRTWERGVENETLSCGSGMVSVALIVMAEQGLDELVLKPASGDRLRVDALGDPPNCRTRLTGPTRIVAKVDPVADLFG